MKKVSYQKIGRIVIDLYFLIQDQLSSDVEEVIQIVRDYNNIISKLTFSEVSLI